jgi:hypothetical protein
METEAVSDTGSILHAHDSDGCDHGKDEINEITKISAQQNRLQITM